MKKTVVPIILIIMIFMSCKQDVCNCPELRSNMDSYDQIPIFNVVGLEIDDKNYCLDDQQVESLLSLILNKDSYREGECGTYFKEGVFVFCKSEGASSKEVYKIQFGCNQGQLRFDSNLSNIKDGLLTLEASEKFSSIVSEIVR